jgi:ADP-ribose pyrophosphatase YjhB (NUDIX family)
VAENYFQCEACDFTFYFNPAVAVAAFVRAPDGRWLFIRRAKPPGQGKLGATGGFVDAGEDAETAVRRELKEELGIEVGRLDYVCSHPNYYEHRGVTYPVLDFFFVTMLAAGSQPQALEDVEKYFWLEESSVSGEDLVFPSMRVAWEIIRRGRD